MPRASKRAVGLAVVVALALAAGALALAGQGFAQPSPTVEPVSTAAPQAAAAQRDALETRYFMTIPDSTRPAS